MASCRNQKQPHAIMISLHLQGHIIPFVNLALKLASKGFTITFAHFEFIHHKISRSENNTTDNIDIFSQARTSGLDIHYTTISDGFPVEFDRNANLELFVGSLINDFPYKVDELIGKIIQSHSSEDYDYFLVADTLAFWADKIDKKYEMVSVSFWTEPALVFSLYYHLELLRKNGHVPVNGRQEEVDYIPGIQSINTKDFMSYLHDSELTLLHEGIFRAFDDVKKADFILCNTVEEFETEAVTALQKYQPFYAIGPLFPLDFTKNLIAQSLLPESDCTEWLNAKAPGSVLYVSFGSLATTEKSVILEIAGGLLLSQVNFIWVLRPGLVGSDGAGILPDGFEDMTKDRGLIVPWCKQNQVLLNPAIGGFLTHCGWNSILESIWCEVPMICYPLFTDQITNRKIVVDDWTIGTNLCDGKSITRMEVAEKIGSLMDEKKSCELRQEIKKYREMLQNALGKDGSSERNFDGFVEILKAQLLKKKDKNERKSFPSLSFP